MVEPIFGVGNVLAEESVVAGPQIGQDGAATVDQTPVSHIVEQTLEPLGAGREFGEGAPHVNGVGRPPVQTEGEQHHDDDRISEHGLILACED